MWEIIRNYCDLSSKYSGFRKGFVTFVSAFWRVFRVEFIASAEMRPLASYRFASIEVDHYNAPHSSGLSLADRAPVEQARQAPTLNDDAA